MAASFGRPPRTDMGERAASLRARALQLAEDDLTAYAGVLEALKLPKDDPERPGRRDQALSAAADGPLAVARAATEVADLAAELAQTGNPHLAGDAVAGALLAEAATRSAVRLLELNLAGLPDDPRLGIAAQLCRQATEARARALADPPD